MCTYGGRTKLRNTCATVATVSSSASHLHPVPLILILRLALPHMLHTSALRCSVILSVRTPLHMRRNICNIKIQGSGGGAQIHNSVRSLVSKCCVILSFNSILLCFTPTPQAADGRGRPSDTGPVFRRRFTRNDDFSIV